MGCEGGASIAFHASYVFVSVVLDREAYHGMARMPLLVVTRTTGAALDWVCTP